MWCYNWVRITKTTCIKKEGSLIGNRLTMGRAWKTKDDRIWRAPPRKTWERIPQKDEKCLGNHWLIGRF